MNKNSIFELSQINSNGHGWKIQKSQGTYNYTFTWQIHEINSQKGVDNKEIKLNVLNKGDIKNVLLINYDIVNKSKELYV